MKAAACLVISMALVPVEAQAQNTVPATGGPITFTPLQHATVQVEWNGTVIQVDPAQGDPSNAKPGDLVLVTDITAII